MREQILEFLKKKGPIVPMELAEELRIDSVIASAYLSDLVSTKTINISAVKLGSSPLYFLPEHKLKLEEYIEKLHPQEQAVVKKLKENKVLRENSLSPNERVAVKHAKDFAVPLEVSFQDAKEVFWKWYALSNQQASDAIRATLTGKPVEEEVVQEKKVEKPVEEVVEKKPEPIKKETKPKPVFKEPKPEIKKEVVEKKEPEEVPIIRPKAKPLPKKEKQEVLVEDSFVKEVVGFLTARNIRVVAVDVEKAKTDATLIVQVPTPVGNMKFYCRAKNKKRVSDLDLMAAYAEGNLKNLPVMFLTKGTLTKKAQDKLEQEFTSVLFVHF
tara:strand:+ start:668 stop:1648 length:981 start_codon:yes stop_codon:yes gene_type:complete